MDEMKLNNGILNKILNVVITRLIRKKLGMDTYVDINSLSVKTGSDTSDLDISIHMSVNNEQLKDFVLKTTP